MGVAGRMGGGGRSTLVAFGLVYLEGSQEGFQGRVVDTLSVIV